MWWDILLCHPLYPSSYQVFRCTLRVSDVTDKTTATDTTEIAFPLPAAVRGEERVCYLGVQFLLVTA